METLISLRSCARCNHDLTDAASIEHGLGPECRGKANEVLAKEIPQAMNPDQAFLVLTLSETQFPAEAATSFRQANEKLLATKAFLAGEGNGQDLRGLVRELAYLLSWKIQEGTRLAILEAIKGLGYVAYAGYIAKASSATAATVELRGDRLYLKAVRNAAGNHALRLIVGREWHQERGEWSVPLAKAGELFEVVRRCWPLTNLGLVAAMVQEANKPKARLIELGSGWVGVEAPYHPEVKASLVALPRADRWWDGQRWRVRGNHRGVVASLVSRFFALA